MKLKMFLLEFKNKLIILKIFYALYLIKANYWNYFRGNFIKKKIIILNTLRFLNLVLIITFNILVNFF
jgi:hypothetical protein